MMKCEHEQSILGHRSRRRPKYLGQSFLEVTHSLTTCGIDYYFRHFRVCFGRELFSISDASLER